MADLRRIRLVPMTPGTRQRLWPNAAPVAGYRLFFRGSEVGMVVNEKRGGRWAAKLTTGADWLPRTYSTRHEAVDALLINLETP